MLRRIVPLSLAMTVCVSFIPTKGNAATLTLLPVNYSILSQVDTLQKNPGDLIAFEINIESSFFFWWCRCSTYHRYF
jgi:hypothetical protein